MVEFAGHRVGDHGDVLGGMVEFVGHRVGDHGETRVDSFKHLILVTSLGEMAGRAGGWSSAGPVWTAGYPMGSRLQEGSMVPYRALGVKLGTGDTSRQRLGPRDLLGSATLSHPTLSSIPPASDLPGQGTIPGPREENNSVQMIAETFHPVF